METATGMRASRVARWAVVATLAACLAGAGSPARAASPGEGRLCYLAHAGDYWQVFTMEPDGEGPRQLTRSPSDKTRCSWFPDGERILVDASEGRLSVADATSGDETPLHLELGTQVIPRPLKGLVDAVVSPDGTRIAFSVSLPTDRDQNRIWVAEADGRGARKLTRDGGLQHEPAWSADGRFLYFLAGEGGQNHDIHRLEIATGSREQITSGQLYHFDVAVSPRGDLAFSSNRSGNYEIWVLRKGEDEPFRVTDDPGADARPAWSRAGDALVFESTRGGRQNLWRVGVAEKGAAGEPVRLTDHPVGARAPAWWHGPRREASR